MCYKHLLLIFLNYHDFNRIADMGKTLLSFIISSSLISYLVSWLFARYLVALTAYCPDNNQDANADRLSSLIMFLIASVFSACFINAVAFATGDNARGSPPGAQRFQEKTRLCAGDIGGLP